MSMDAQDEPVPKSLPIDGDVRTTDVANDNNNNELDNSEMGLEDHEGLDDVESDNSGNGGPLVVVVMTRIQITMTTSSPFFGIQYRINESLCCMGEYDFQLRSHELHYLQIQYSNIYKGSFIRF